MGVNSLISSFINSNLVRSGTIELGKVFWCSFNDFTADKNFCVWFYPVIHKIAYSFFQWNILMIFALL